MKTLAFFVLALTFGVGAFANQPTYRFAVTVPGQKDPLIMRAKIGESQTTKVDEKTTEYTKQITGFDRKSWESMVVKGTAPSHDFVECNKEVCWMGVKGAIHQGTTIKIRLDDVDGRVVTTVNFHSRTLLNLPMRTLNGSPAMEFPDTQELQQTSKAALQLGGALVLLEDMGDRKVEVKLVAIE